MARIDLPPGVVYANSRKRNSANWREVNLVRWEGTTMEPIGGWERLNYEPFASPVRAIHKWTDNSGIQYTAYLCEQHCYVDSGGEITDITPVGGIAGPSSPLSGGYGDSLFGGDTYGDERAGVSRRVVVPPAYTLDNWGEQLRAMTSADGRLLGWDPNTPGSVLGAVTDAPNGNRSFVVVPERHIVLFGAEGSASKFMWSDQEDDTNWDIASLTSKAGEFDVEPRSPISAHKLLSDGILMMTARGVAYSIRYIGLPYIFAYQKVGEAPAPISPASIVEIPAGAMWMSANGFHSYNGVSVAPIECPVWDWVKSYLDPFASKYKANAVNVLSQSEAWFFFCTEAADIANRVVIFNYRYNTWSMGKLSRTAGLSFPNDPNPIMSDGANVYKHEEGYMYSGAVELPWAETFSINTNSGGSFTTLKQMLPEVAGDASHVSFRFTKVSNPTSSAEVMSSTKVIRPNGYVDIRETSRELRMRVEGTEGAYWSLGVIDLDLVQRGVK